MNRPISLDLTKVEKLNEDNYDSFIVHNKRVWMNKKAEYLTEIDQNIRKEYNIDNDQNIIISLFLPFGKLWTIDFKIKKDKYDNTILITTDEVIDLDKKYKLKAMTSNLINDKNIYNFNVNGYMIMIDYVKKDFLSERREKEEAMKALIE